MRVLDVDEAKVILDWIRIRVRSGTAQILTNHPILHFPFWHGPRFWEGKWRDGYCSNLWHWVDSPGEAQKLFGKGAEDEPEEQTGKEIKEGEEEEKEREEEMGRGDEAGPSATPQPEKGPAEAGQEQW